MVNKLTANSRKIKDKNLKLLRQQGQIPAVVYGPEIKNQHLILNYQEFARLFQEVGRSKIFDLQIAKKKPLKVVVHEIQINPLTDKIIHADLYQIDMKKKITTTIPLVFQNESPAVKQLGGIFIKNITEIEIEALPADLIHEIKVDISGLKKFNDKIIVSDLPCPAEVKIKLDANEVVALVNPPRSEKELEELETQVTEEEAVEEVGKVSAKEEVEDQEAVKEETAPKKETVKKEKDKDDQTAKVKKDE